MKTDRHQSRWFRAISRQGIRSRHLMANLLPIFSEVPKSQKQSIHVNQWLAVLIANRSQFRRLGLISGWRLDKRHWLHTKATSSKIRSTLRSQSEQWISPEWRAEEGKMITIADSPLQCRRKRNPFHLTDWPNSDTAKSDRFRGFDWPWCGG